MHSYQELSGPDFMDALADVECANGNEINRNEYRRRAVQWRNDQEALERTQQKCHELEGQLARTPRRREASFAGAVTPTDRRT